VTVADEADDPACFSGHQRPEVAKRACAAAAAWSRAQPSAQAARAPAQPQWRRGAARWLRRSWRKLRRKLTLESLQELAGLVMAVGGAGMLLRLMIPRGVGRRGRTEALPDALPDALLRGERTGDGSPSAAGDEACATDDSGSVLGAEGGSAAAGEQPLRRRGRVIPCSELQSGDLVVAGAPQTAQAPGRRPRAPPAGAQGAANVGEAQAGADAAVRKAARYAAELRRRASQNLR
jgi:hypothetical protein